MYGGLGPTQTILFLNGRVLATVLKPIGMNQQPILSMQGIKQTYEYSN
jgi:hypothetical protein